MLPDARHRVSSLARPLLHPVLITVVLTICLDSAQWLRAAPLWVDEEMIALNFRDRSFRELAGPLWLGQGAPLGWLFLQRAAVLALGTSELSLRLFPLLAGIGTLVVAGWVARRWMTPLAGSVFVLICWIGQWLSHYRFEVKHYSADAMAALLLPALAAWAAEPAQDPEAARVRWMRWWLVATLTQWVAFGALFVTPLCAVLLMAAILARHGVRAATRFAAAGALWLLSFWVHYLLSLQFTDRSRHLRNYWAGELPPEGLDLVGLVVWTVDRLGTLANNPGGTELALALWLCALSGFVACRRWILGAMFASVPLAACVLAAIRQVPLGDRLALWIVPALYLGVAMLLDAGVRQVMAGWRQKRWLRSALGAIPLLASLYVSAGIVVQGHAHLDVGTAGDSNHALDDRSAVAWLMQRRQAGDVIVTTRLGWPAVWWYGPVSLRRPAPGGRLPDGGLMLEAFHDTLRADCGRDLQDALNRRRRVLVHVGFPDMPEGFYESLIGELSRFGDVVDSAEFSIISRTAVIRLHHPGSLASAADNTPRQTGGGDALEGCVGLRAARRW